MWFCVLGRRCQAWWQLTRPGAIEGLWAHGVLKGSPFKSSESLGNFESVCRKGAGANTHRLLLCFPPQGSTLRKRKMYEEFLSKVSILGQWLPPPAAARPSGLSACCPPGRLPVHTPRVSGRLHVLGVTQVWDTHMHAHRSARAHNRNVCACTCVHTCARASTHTALCQNRALCAPLLGTSDPSSPMSLSPRVLCWSVSVLHLCHYLQLLFQPVSLELNVHFSFW